MGARVFVLPVRIQDLCEEEGRRKIWPQKAGSLAQMVVRSSSGPGDFSVQMQVKSHLC